MKGSVSHNKRTLLLNAAWNWLGFATAMVVAFIVCPIYVRSLGDERYGIWSLVEATVAYFALLDLGIGASIVRYVAKFEAIDDRDRLNQIFSTTCAIFIAAACLTLAVCAGLAAVWERPLGVPPELSVDTRWLLFLLGCNVGVELIAGVFGAVLLGLGRFPARVALDVVLRIGGAAAMVAALWGGYGLLGIGIVCLAFTLVKGLFLALLVWHYLPSLRFSPSLVSMETFRLIRGYSFLAFVAMIAGRISFSTSTIVIGAFLAPEYITYYVIGARLAEYVKSGSRSITSVLTPAISALEARGHHEAIERVLMAGTRYIVWLVLPVELGLVFLGKPFLTLWLGERLAGASYPTLVILSIPLFLALSQSISGRILYGIGRLKWFTAIVVAEALINLSLSAALVNWIGIEGVALGTAIPNVCANVAIACYTCRLLQVAFVAYAWKSFAKPLLVAPLAPVVWMALMDWVSITSWGIFILVGASGTIVYALAAFAVEFGGSGMERWFPRPAEDNMPDELSSPTDPSLEYSE
jgi:O-antigen/teichoic acid export membrane protein